MKFTKTIYQCDLCHFEVRKDVDMLPDGWRTAGQWVERMYICPNCRGQLERMKIINREPFATSITPYQVDGASPAKAGA